MSEHAQDDVQPLSEQGRVMVIDDSSTMRRILGSLLEAAGYAVALEASGAVALARAQETPPDIFLVDVEMPDMDGFELCQAIKGCPALAEIPVIFISAHGNSLDKVRAFGAGAADYVTKPFDVDEVQARIRTHVELRRLHLEMAAQNARLLAQNDQLRALEKMRDDLTHMVVHDLRNPLTCIYGFLRIVEQRGRDLLPPYLNECIESSLESTDDLIEMVTSLLDISKLEAGAMKLERERCNVAEIAGEVMGRMQALRGNRTMTVTAQVDAPEAWGDGGLLRRVLVNIIGNAVKFTEDSGHITVALSQREDLLRVEIIDDGPGVEPEWREKIFEKFGQATNKGAGKKYATGLGLTFCKLAVEAHGGRIGLESEMGHGCTFWFEVPAARCSDLALAPAE
ncbi:MAG: hybrid sensor histidine kinase/response regulator [Proteobacteria bacterium]|nr:hybrid sensor histidine kinase/response regulator [Pseudomonadota bacterium]